jgi:hypothetical protein
MKTIVLLAIWFGLLAVPMRVISEERQEAVLFSATIVDVEYIADLEPAFDGDIPVGSRFAVKVEGVEVLRGELQDPVTRLEVAATHQEVLRVGERFAVFAEISSDGLRVIHWDWIFSATCVPDRFWLNSGLAGEETYKEMPTPRRGPRSCVLVSH